MGLKHKDFHFHLFFYNTYRIKLYVMCIFTMLAAINNNITRNARRIAIRGNIQIPT